MIIIYFDHIYIIYLYIDDHIYIIYLYIPLQQNLLEKISITVNTEWVIYICVIDDSFLTAN